MDGAQRSLRISVSQARDHAQRAAHHLWRAAGPFSGMALGALLSTVATFAIASILTLEEFGRLSSGLAIAVLSYPVVAGGAQAVLLAESGQEFTQRRGTLLRVVLRVESSLGWRSLALVAGLSCLTVGRSLLWNGRLDSHIVVGGLLAGAMAYSAAYRAALTGLQLPGLGVLADSVARPLFYATLGLIVGLLGGGASAVMLAPCLGAVAGAVTMRRRIAKQLLRTAGRGVGDGPDVDVSMRAAMVGELSVRSLRRLDLVWLGLIGAHATAGLVALAWKVAEVAVLPVAAMLSLAEADLAGSARASTMRQTFLKHWRLTAVVGLASIVVAYAAYTLALEGLIVSMTDVSPTALHFAVAVLLAGQLANLSLGPSMQVLVASRRYVVFAALSLPAALAHAATLVWAGDSLEFVVVVDAMALALWSAILLFAALKIMRPSSLPEVRNGR